ncbi:hypothetical protein [Bacillus mycoides]|uniref:hypothetical protein n=1 Tax=Bacillus mycoides TaxID=1405 RepID=UPI002E23A0AE|nr:hypothetical protein [Bacillus mycoides]
MVNKTCEKTGKLAKKFKVKESRITTTMYFKHTSENGVLFLDEYVDDFSDNVWEENTCDMAHTIEKINEESKMEIVHRLLGDSLRVKHVNGVPSFYIDYESFINRLEFTFENEIIIDDTWM